MITALKIFALYSPKLCSKIRTFILCEHALTSERFHEKIRRQALADLGKRPKAGCRPMRAFDDEQQADGGEDFHETDWRFV